MARVPIKQYLSLLYDYLKPQLGRVTLLGIFMFTAIGLGLVAPQIVRYFIDTARSGGETRDLVIAGVLFIVVGLGRSLVLLVSSYLGQDVGWRATNRMRENLALHCLKLDMKFHHEYTPGEMVERVDGDTTALSNFFSQFMLQVVGSSIFLVGVLAMIFREDWRMGTAMTLFTLIAFWVFNLTRNIAVPAFTAEREGYARLYGFIEERLVGIEDIRTNGADAYAMNRFYDANDEVYDRVLKSEVMSETLRAITGVLFALGFALSMGLGIYLFREGTFTVGAVFMVFHYTSMIREPLQQISIQITDLQRATAGLQRIESLHRTVSALENGTERLPDSGPLEIAFEGVSFAYHEGDPVLKGVSFRLAPGRILGLLGRTGSGKTTITRLLFRLYDVQQGTVRVGEHSVQNLQMERLRQKIGLVTQDVQLFNATVRDNLRLFDPGIEDNRILEVLDRLELSEWYASLSDGLDTLLASGGVGLSAGEGQLLAFARVFLKDPGLVILDEPSSRLDPATEQRINRAVEALLENRTGIIIAHRLGTVQRVHDIMILEEGQIREFGAREALVSDSESCFAQLLKTGLEEVLT